METKHLLETLLRDFGTTPVCETEFRRRIAQMPEPPSDVSGLWLAFQCLRGESGAIRALQDQLETMAVTVSRKLLTNDELRAEVCQQTCVLLLYGRPPRGRGYL